MERRVIQPETLADPREELLFSQAIVVDDTLYASGQLGWDENLDPAGEDIRSQARQAFDNVERVLAEVGKDLNDVVKVTSYLIDPQERLAEYRTVWDEVFDPPYPCHTALGVEQLAAEPFLLEVEVEVPLD